MLQPDGASLQPALPAPSASPQVRKDGQASRTQLQLAAKNTPSMAQRFFVYASQVRALPCGRRGLAGLGTLACNWPSLASANQRCTVLLSVRL